MVSKTTLADKITSKLVEPKNKDFDIEDVGFNDQEDVSESESEQEEEAEKEHYVKVSKSQLRHDGVSLGKKYKGEKASRSAVFGEDEEDGSSGNDLLADVTDSSDEEMEEKGESEDDDAYKRSQLGKLLENEKKQMVSRLSSSAKSDAVKGYYIISQYRLFDKILDLRIKVQKALAGSNQLPVSKEAYEENRNEESDEKFAEAKEALEEVLSKVLLARAKLHKKDRISDKDFVAEVGRKRTFDEYAQESGSLDTALNPYRKSVLVKWSNRVQSASGASALNAGKFKTINQNVYTQFENTAQDMDRLVKRTKINRKNVVPIGYVAPTEKDNEEEDYSNIDKSLQQNEYVYDDEDFYRVLLNDMIDKKITDKQAASSAAIVTLSRNRMHKNYERMSSKGRKIKYTVQEPLRNFEQPKSDSYKWNDDHIDQLFASLFGHKVNMSESDTESESEAESSKAEGEKNMAVNASTLRLFG